MSYAQLPLLPIVHLHRCLLDCVNDVNTHQGPGKTPQIGPCCQGSMSACLAKLVHNLSCRHTASECTILGQQSCTRSDSRALKEAAATKSGSDDTCDLNFQVAELKAKTGLKATMNRQASTAVCSHHDHCIGKGSMIGL